MAFNDIYMNNGVSLIDITPNMTSENTPSPYSVSATSYYSPYYAWKAFSGNVNDSWTASSNSSHITFDFSVNTEIDAVILFLATGNNDFGGKTVKIQGSYDNVGYYDLWQEQNPITGSERIIQFNQRYNYRYYRVDVQGGSNWFAIYSIRFLKINQSDKKLTIHKTLKANLKQTVDAGIKELHLTEDGGFYTYDKDGNLVQIGHDHEHKDVLDKLTEDSNGNLLYNGKEISTGGASTTGGSNVKREKLKITANGITEITTDIVMEDISKVDFYISVNGLLYIDGITANLNSDNKIVISLAGLGFDLEKTDNVYLIYCEEVKQTNNENNGTCNGDFGLSLREW